tara:strand:- start:2351 stop:5380 length:3030 start_codon:yes stop_codon:yes gene_type:complete
MSFDKTKISIKEAKKILKSIYNIEGEITSLNGEVDFNFRVITNKSKKYLLKISRPDYEQEYIDYQIDLLEYINQNSKIEIPKIIYTISNKKSSSFQDINGENRSVRLMSWIEGRLWSTTNPIKKSLRYELGFLSSQLTKSLKDFNHPYAHRSIKWDISKSLWVESHLDIFDSKKAKVLKKFIRGFKNNLRLYQKLEKSVIHNDINDNNIIVTHDFLNPEVKSIIDFGDSVYSQTINDLAITCSYGVMNHKDPLSGCLDIVKGYNENRKIKDEELKLLYNLIAMRLVISVTISSINRYKEPNNRYLFISERAAWDLIYKWKEVNSEFAYYSFRRACSIDAHPNKTKLINWAKKTNFSIKDLLPEIKKSKFYNLDLSVGSKWLGNKSEIEDLDLFQFKISKLQKKIPDSIISGGYLEPRSIYTSNTYEKNGENGEENRTIHLGLDFWVPPGTKVCSVFDGEIVAAVNDKGNKEYGGLVIIKHKVEDFEFFSLYGHNTVDSVLKNKIGSKVKRGKEIAVVANYPENGNWAPHLHFQIMHTMLDFKVDFPGVCFSKQENVWKDICPNPNILFKQKELSITSTQTNIDIINYRKQHIGKSLKLHYDEPIRIVRGEGVYLIDHKGRKYLDTVNNVAHVGHENEDVVNEGKSQMSLLNTNSRYLHENINQLTKELLSTVPKELSVVHYVNSGSEANELAIRMMKAHTGSNNIIVSQHGYHGNTNVCVDISSYKFDGKGGNGPPENTYVIPIPNNFNGKHKGNKIDDKYVSEIKKQIEKIKLDRRILGGFIIEPIISCGGQVELPKGFLKKAYNEIRNNGGICISDEVQVGCGRIGKSFWGFQAHNVIPDIITVGKPLGNGHPIGAVICKKEIAESFANGMEFFNTFGGNPVSCSIALEVIKTVKSKKLQENAKIVGNYFKNELIKLSRDNKIIADVRGEGLFLGIEFLDSEKNPLSNQTKYIVNRLKDFGILSSVDGPFNNVIKIKPPMIFNKSNCQSFIKYLKIVLEEDYITKGF